MGINTILGKRQKQCKKIQFGTFNARSESVFEKPSFKGPIRNKRCLVLVDGFYEWHEHNKKKYPFYIKLKNDEAFCLAGIWDTWMDKDRNREYNTFSILTTDASPLLEKIHNTKKRMPVIIKEEDEEKWLSNISEDELKKMFIPFNDELIQAYPVSKMIANKNIDTNIAEAIKRVDYEELGE